ncbi:MAG: hypothetical protein EBU84_00760 [Actinobacteria bacterium]|jgi:hypothetical protein|nr:hypothetical protein [Actinomycetota bacterium]
MDRIINPKARFVTISCNTPGAGAPIDTLNRQSFFKFDQDSVLHRITINSNIVCNGALSQKLAAVAYNQGENSVGVIQSAQPWPGLIWVDDLLNPVAGTILSAKSVSIDMRDIFVHSNTGIGIYANGIGAGNINVNVSIIYNPIAEWVNFREPTIGVRL